jgi:hypothetical protein
LEAESTSPCIGKRCCRITPPTFSSFLFSAPGLTDIEDIVPFIDPYSANLVDVGVSRCARAMSAENGREASLIKGYVADRQDSRRLRKIEELAVFLCGEFGNQLFPHG